MKSSLLNLDYKDLLKGALLALLSAIITGVYDLVSNGILPSTWEQFKPIVLSSVTAFLAYIIKNALSNNKGEFLKKDK